MHVRGHAGDAAWQNLAALSDEFSEEIRILVIDRFHGNVDPAARHRAIGAAERGTAFGSFWLHLKLSRLAVEGVPLQKRIVFLLFQTIGRARAFFVPRGRVARDRLAERLGFGAFEGNNFLRHGDYSFASVGAASSSSASPPSSSVKPKSEVTDWRTREALLCFSSCD